MRFRIDAIVRASRLAALASGIYDGQLHRDRKKRIFLDLNPECFREIIDWLSACELIQPGSEMPRVATPPGHADTMEHMLRFLALDERPAPAEDLRAQSGLKVPRHALRALQEVQVRQAHPIAKAVARDCGREVSRAREHERRVDLHAGASPARAESRGGRASA